MTVWAAKTNVCSPFVAPSIHERLACTALGILVTSYDLDGSPQERSYSALNEMHCKARSWAASPITRSEL